MVPLLHIQNLSIDFVSNGSVSHAVKNISLQLMRGEIVALVGESGSGKSVSALSILQLVASPPARYVQGSILFSENGLTQKDLLQTSGENLRQIRGNKIAMIFQEPMSSLNPLMNCGDQVSEALLSHQHITRIKAREKAIEWFDKLRLPQPELISKKFPHQLSGGQKQRVMIAMAMCCQPALLICDEPTTALDVTVQKTILNQIRELQKQQNMGVLFITHDLGVVAEIADRVAIMYKGEIVEEKSREEIFHAPSHAYTKALIACRPSAGLKGRRLPVVEDFLSGCNDNEFPDVQKTQADLSELMRVENVNVSFAGKKNFLGRSRHIMKAVDDVSFFVYKGETLGLVGESGCGKTTLGRTLLRLTEPDSGAIFYKGENMLHAKKETLKQLRKEVQLVFQDPYSSLNPTLMIGKAIEEPIRIVGKEKVKSKRKNEVGELLQQVHLSVEMGGRYPHEFSGGQRQRIVIARALALRPQLLVCDESVSALDVSVQAQVLNLLNELKRNLGLTMLFISHDLSVVRYMCDRIMVMQNGRIVETGTAEQVYDHPLNAYTKKLMEAVPQIPGRGNAQKK